MLALTGTAAAVSLAGCSGGDGTDGSDGGDGSDGADGDDGSDGGAADFGGWFDDVSNYDGVADHTGEDEVTVDVGADDGFAFAPPAVRVSTGTTVVWQWTGQGGQHDVTADDGSFESELVDDSDHEFTHTFEEAGTYKYACTPHESMGMKGAVVVE